MEPVDDLLGTMTIEDARYVRIAVRPPWGIAFPARHLARLILVARGSCWLTGGEADEPQRLVEGDCFLVRAGSTFALRDVPGRALVDCDDVEKDAAATAVVGGDGDGDAAEIVSARVTVDPVAADALVALLAPLTRLRLDATSGALLRATFDLLARESAVRGPGADHVVARLSEVLFVQALRAGAESDERAVGALAALRDPQLAPALRAMHADLARPWTLAELARASGMSRSSFAAAFRARTGDTPLGYLTTWRLHRAKRLLREPSTSVHEIAVAVGYRTGQALSRAFLRHEGVAPGTWRRASTGSPGAACDPAAGTPRRGSPGRRRSA